MQQPGNGAVGTSSLALSLRLDLFSSWDGEALLEREHIIQLVLRSDKVHPCTLQQGSVFEQQADLFSFHPSSAPNCAGWPWDLFRDATSWGDFQSPQSNAGEGLWFLRIQREITSSPHGVQGIDADKVQRALSTLQLGRKSSAEGCWPSGTLSGTQFAMCLLGAFNFW